MANVWLSAAAELFREVFEGKAAGKDSTWVVEGKEGIFDALDSVDAARASRHVEAGTPSLVAHAYHMLYALRVANSYAGRSKPEGDWESSWAVQEATPEEWAALRAKIAEEYGLFSGFLASATIEEGLAATGALAAVVHAGFHLGAMRALLRLV